MDINTWAPIITAAAALSGIALGWAGRARSVKQDVVQQTSVDTMQRADVEYIKRGVDDIRADVRNQGQRLDGVTERLIRVEESAKQAHKRIDRIEGVEGRG